MFKCSHNQMKHENIVRMLLKNAKLFEGLGVKTTHICRKKKYAFDKKYEINCNTS